MSAVAKIAFASLYASPAESAQLDALRMLGRYRKSGTLADLKNWVIAAERADQATLRARYAAVAIGVDPDA